MSNYHFSVKVFSRSNGASVVAKAAYRSGESLHDEMLGKTFDYTRKGNIIFNEIILPENAPEWANDRNELWNALEFADKRVTDGQVAREVVVSLQRELSIEQNIDMLQKYVKDNFASQGMVADISLHDEQASDGGQNLHAHILLSMREFNEEGELKKAKNRDWNKKAELVKWRENWAEAINDNLESNAIEDKVSHLSLAEQGIDRIPQIHVGVSATHANDNIDGIQSIRYERNEAIKQENKFKEFARVAAQNMREKVSGFFNRVKEAMYYGADESAGLAEGANHSTIDYENETEPDNGRGR